MKFVSRVMIAAALAFGVTSAPTVSEAACATCKPAQKTQVKTKYNYRTVQKVNNVTRYRDVRKTKNVYMVRDVRMMRVVRISYVAKDLGYKRVTKAEYDRLKRARKVGGVRKVGAVHKASAVHKVNRARVASRDCNCWRPIAWPGNHR